MTCSYYCSWTRRLGPQQVWLWSPLWRHFTTTVGCCHCHVFHWWPAVHLTMLCWATKTNRCSVCVPRVFPFTLQGQTFTQALHPGASHTSTWNSREDWRRVYGVDKLSQVWQRIFVSELWLQFLQRHAVTGDVLTQYHHYYHPMLGTLVLQDCCNDEEIISDYTIWL